MKSPKLKLLFVNGHLLSGGVETSLISLLRNLDFSRYDVDLLLCQEGMEHIDSIPEEVNIIKCNIEKAFGPLLSTFKNCIAEKNLWPFLFRLGWTLAMKFDNVNLRMFRRYLGIQSHYDVAIAYRPGVCTQIVGRCVKSNRKFAWWHHGEINTDIKRLITDWTNFNKIVTVSNNTASMLRTLSSDLNNIEVIPNIIDIDKIIAKSNVYEKSELCYDDSILNIVSVGRLSPEKRFDLIIPIACDLCDKRMEFEWHIIGDGEERNHLEEQIHAYRLEEYVKLHGNQPNPYSWIKHADMMVHPSPVESFGIVIVEAMALNVPCIAVKSAGSMELIDGKNGILTNFDHKELSSAIIDLQNLRNKRQSLADKGFRSSVRYTSNEVIPQFERLLNR